MWVIFCVHVDLSTHDFTTSYLEEIECVTSNDQSKFQYPLSHGIGIERYTGKQLMTGSYVKAY